MNVGRYLRGEDRHIGTARTTKAKKEKNPMDMPLPCDVKVGHVTIRKGVALSVLVARMQVLFDMAQSAMAQSEQEPVAWVHKETGVVTKEWSFEKSLFEPLYTTPPTQQSCSQHTAAEGEDSKRAWVGLTKQQRIDIIERLENEHSQHELIDAIEAKLKAKNERKEKNT